MSRPSGPNVRDTLLGALVVAFVVSPAYLHNYGYGLDYTNHPWLIWNQGLAIGHTGHPSLWLHASGGLGIFQPLYGFYGGSLYAIFGGLSALLGQRPDTAYVLSIVIFVAMSYRGVWLLGAQAGLSRLAAHLPPFIFVTSAYYVTDIYARGAWTELAAISGLVFGLGYGLLLARERWTGGRVAWFAFGIVLATGSHNISLVWGGLLVLLIGGGAYAIAGEDRIAVRKAAPVIGIAILAILVNAWFLLLDITHNKDVLISSSGFSWEMSKMFDTPAAILNPLRLTPVGSTTTGLVITAPLFALILAVVVRVRARNLARAETALTRRLWWVAAAGIVLLLVLMMMPAGGWTALPSQLNLIQYPFRLGGWLALMVSVVLIFSLRLLTRLGADSRSLVGYAVAGLIVLTVLQAGAQLYPKLTGLYAARARSTAFVNGANTPPESFYDPGSYRDTTRPAVNTSEDRTVTIPTPPPGTTRWSAVVTLPAGPDPIRTNIDAGPWVAKIQGTGFTVVGRSADGRVAIARVPGGPDRVRIAIVADGGGAQTLAGTLSVLSLLALFGIIGTLVVRDRREGKRGWGPSGGVPVAAGEGPGTSPASDTAEPAPHLDKVER